MENATNGTMIPRFSAFEARMRLSWPKTFSNPITAAITPSDAISGHLTSPVLVCKIISKSHQESLLSAFGRVVLLVFFGFDL